MQMPCDSRLANAIFFGRQVAIAARPHTWYANEIIAVESKRNENCAFCILESVLNTGDVALWPHSLNLFACSKIPQK